MYPLLYPTHPEYLNMIFDLTKPDGAASLERQRTALAGHTSVETLDEDHTALIVRPGWVSRAAV